MNQEVKCKHCGVLIKNPRKTQQYCSYKCSNRATYLSKVEKTKQTMFERYGVENISQAEEIKKKKKETMIRNFGSLEEAYSSMTAKVEQTTFERHGVKNISCKEGTAAKRKATTFERHGDENYRNIEKSIHTSMEKYGSDFYVQTEEYKRRHRQTCLEKYGVENVSQVDAVRKKISEKASSTEFRLKVYQTKKKNGTFRSSKPESEIFERLKQKFPLTIHHHHSELYPFECDFYIPELDLWIEYQGTWTHGKEPYDASNILHREQLDKWTSKDTTFYRNAVYVWSELDPRKRQTAAVNKLNWIEFWNMNEFNEWFERI